MISFEEAKKIANEYVPGVYICREYATAWEFDRKDAPTTDGGMDGPVVIMKDTGKAVGLTWFLMHSDPKRYIDIDEDMIRECCLISGSTTASRSGLSTMNIQQSYGLTIVVPSQSCSLKMCMISM